MTSQLHRKIGSLLGLLAILMATLAPTVSHMLAAHGSVDGLPAAFCSAGAAPDNDTTGTTSDRQGALHAQACAYCGLLAHLPVLPSAPSGLVPDAPAAHLAAALKAPQVRGVPLFTAAQPRAPPLSS